VTFPFVMRRLQAGLTRDAPVLFLSECVLVYLQVAASSAPPARGTFAAMRPLIFHSPCQPGEGDAIVRWAAGFVNGGAGGVFVTYEQIHPHDAFGQVVLHCAAARDLSNIFVIDTRQIYHIRNDKTTSAASVYDPPPPAELRQRPRADVLQVMMRNLVTRGCPLYSLHAYPDLPAQKTRCVCCPRRPCDNVRCTCLHQSL
jgi:hypothetical protein